MNTQTNKAPEWAQEGSVVVVVSQRNSQPRTANVTKVTKAGWFQVDNDSEYFMYAGVRSYGNKQPYAQARSRHNKTEVFPAVSMNVLQAEYNAAQTLRAAKDAERNAAQQARDAEVAKELAALKAELNNFLPVRMLDKLSDGSRMVVLVVPTVEEAKSRKGDYEMVMVKLSKSTRWYTEDGPNPRPVQMAMTVAHNETSSFGSYSTSDYATDEEALWEAVRQVRRDW